ncbi:MAG: VWA domain-containing protein [Gammaproteobacteria bacterium]|nr:VWA domain-containing protein [Gammaproteobacteria bacterium]
MRRRDIEEIGLSFLDVICCGFGAIILLLMIVKTVQPIVLEQTDLELDGIVALKRESKFDIEGQTRVLKRQIEDEQRQLDQELSQLARVKQQVSDILGQFSAAEDQAVQQVARHNQLSEAKQSLTDEMERLLGLNFSRLDNTIGGIPVDSEYIIFVIDTSGSMYNFAWPLVVQKLQETLDIYPTVKGIQVMNDMGNYMFSQYVDTWIPDTPARRRAIVGRLRTWNAFSNSSPVEGVTKAITTFYAPDKKISVYVFGDDFQGRSVEVVVDTIDRFNAADEDGNCRVRVHAIGFPVLGQAQSAANFAALMRELTARNCGTFVGLASYE